MLRPTYKSVQTEKLLKFGRLKNIKVAVKQFLNEVLNPEVRGLFFDFSSGIDE